MRTRVKEAAYEMRTRAEKQQYIRCVPGGRRSSLEHTDQTGETKMHKNADQAGEGTVFSIQTRLEKQKCIRMQTRAEEALIYEIQTRPEKE